MRNEESLGLGFGEERESSERDWGFGVGNESGLSALEKREEWEVKTRLRAIFFCFKVSFFCLWWVLLMVALLGLLLLEILSLFFFPFLIMFLLSSPLTNKKNYIFFYFVKGFETQPN